MPEQFTTQDGVTVTTHAEDEVTPVPSGVKVTDVSEAVEPEPAPDPEVTRHEFNEENLSNDTVY
jgi:hypothetical protein